MPNDSQIGEQFDDQNGPKENPETTPPLKPMDKNQKIAAASLAVFAVLIVVLWSAQLKNNIYSPFNGNTSGSAALEPTADDQVAADLALKNKDTDSDGLSDYDELYIYKTSPYLADSDSDGIKDGDEIKKGTDPNCPTGRTCVSSGADLISSTTPASSGALNNAASQNAALNSLLGQYGASNPAANPAAASGTGDLTADQQKQILQNIDAATLRQMLLDNGMDKAQLDQISDTELMQSYNETLNNPAGQ